MSSPKKSSHNDCLKIRETMFEFLKRKKHMELENSLKKSNEEQKSTYKIQQK